MSPRRCPQCKKKIRKYFFSKNLTLICGSCQQIIFPTEWKEHSELESSLRKKTWKTWNTGTNYNNETNYNAYYNTSTSQNYNDNKKKWGQL